MGPYYILGNTIASRAKQTTIWWGRTLENFTNMVSKQGKIHVFLCQVVYLTIADNSNASSIGRQLDKNHIICLTLRTRGLAWLLEKYEREEILVFAKFLNMHLNLFTQ